MQKTVVPNQRADLYLNINKAKLKIRNYVHIK